MLIENINFKMINCLEYALNFWKQDKNYKIYYNSDHCVNLPDGIKIDGFLKIEDFGFNYFENWFKIEKLISKEAYEILIEYFNEV